MAVVSRAEQYSGYRVAMGGQRMVGSLRAGIRIVVALYVPFLALDYFVYPDEFSCLATTRLSLALPLLAAYRLAPYA